MPETISVDTAAPAPAPAPVGQGMSDLPDEIIHITQGFVPLSLLLSRLAQTTHNALQEKVAELAKMPLPASTAANGANGANINGANGAPSCSSSGPDDTSMDNMRKKGTLTHFAQDMHGKWLKALVITEWSRKSHLVSKLIDLKFHIDQQRILYNNALDNIVNVKRDLTFARMPSPDLKTALQILSTGTAPWMPDLQYIEPPPLTPEEKLKWLGELDTLLSLRLNLDDFDKIPQQFRDYEIASGRVTFKVKGEFEVDLTIADDDFSKPFWFIDFRYAFTPAASSLPASLRAYLEGCVNEVLEKDGLLGCYQFLHEFVLTSKMNEIKRQALQLSRTSWTGTLSVEQLNRSLAIQYWTTRSGPATAKSWILLGVNSRRKPADGTGAASPSSQLEIKWYREGKEVKDANIKTDLDNLSTETLLTDIVSRHVEHILTSIHNKLAGTARFRSKQAAMSLSICSKEPSLSVLSTRVGRGTQDVSLIVEPMTGVFAVKPPSKFTIQPEHALNNGHNPTDDGVTCLEQVRCAILEDELHRRSACAGWHVRKSPISPDELRSVIKSREWTRAVWLQKSGWSAGWFVAVVLGLGGDEWWLLESKPNQPTKSVTFKSRLPLSNGYFDLTDEFWQNLGFFTTGFIAQAVDLQELHRHRIKSRMHSEPSLSMPKAVHLPAIDAALSTLFPTMLFGKTASAAATTTSTSASASANMTGSDRSIGNNDILSLLERTGAITATKPQAWAQDNVTIAFKGLQSVSRPSGGTSGGEAPLEPEVLLCESEAVIKVRRPSKFASLQGLDDEDVAYDPDKGQFSLRVRRPVGEPILAALKSRVQAIDRFVNFLEALDAAKGAITSELVTLGQVAFYYSAPGDDQRWRVALDLSRQDIEINVDRRNPHIRVLDLMRRLVNCEGGVGALMAWLPVSLQALRAIEKMEAEWEGLQASRRGRLKFSMKSISCMSLEYHLSWTTVLLQVKMRPRRGEAWWHVSRSGPSPDKDSVATALKGVWNSSGDGWFGLKSGAAGRPTGGVVPMLLAVDAAMRSAATTGGSTGNKDVVVLE